MKICLLFIFFYLYSASAYADRCVLNKSDIVQAALTQLKDIEKVVHYCPTCVGDNHVRYINVFDVKIVQKNEEQIIQIGGENIDLAYIYLPTIQTNIYHNLGYVVQCTDLVKSPVLEYLNVKDPYGIENIENLSKELEQCTSENCVERIYQYVLQNYFEGNSNMLKGFDFVRIALPLVISKEIIANLLSEIAFYYGEE